MRPAWLCERRKGSCYKECALAAPETTNRPREDSVMNIRSFSHLGNQALEHRLAAEVAHNRVSTATLIALIAEVDARRL